MLRAMTDTPTANSEQSEYWNQTAGPKWTQLSDVIDSQIAPLGSEAMDRIGVRSGQRVLVDAASGEVVVEPTDEMPATFS